MLGIKLINSIGSSASIPYEHEVFRCARKRKLINKLTILSLIDAEFTIEGIKTVSVEIKDSFN